MVAPVKKRRITKNGVDLDAVKLPKLEVLDPFDVEPLDGQIRKQFFGISELSASIETAGQATPIIVRETPGQKLPYGLVDGERRLKACLTIRKAIIAVIHDGSMDLRDVHALSVAANFGRQTHDCMEIAGAIHRFREQGKKWHEIRAIFGKSISWVHQHYNLMKLHPQIQEWLVPGAVPIFGDSRNRDRDLDSKTSLGSRRIKSRMNFGIASLMIPLPRDAQLKIAKKIVGTDTSKSFVEVRRMVLQEARKQPGFKSTMRPHEYHGSIHSLMHGFATRVATFNDMRGSDFDRVFGEMSITTLQKIKQSINKAKEELEHFSISVDGEIAKRNTKAHTKA